MLLHGRRHALRRLGGVSLLTIATSGCATILYPERRGNRRGRIDVGPLILDILWFIPGIIPGVIALAVDFGTGAIYTSEGITVDRARARRLGVQKGEQIAVHAPIVATPTEVELRLVTDPGEVVDRRRARWGPQPRHPVLLDVPREASERAGALELRVCGAERRARYPLLVGITREDQPATGGASSSGRAGG
jgi:hypothetical protein